MESAKKVSSRVRGVVAAAVALGTLAALSVLAGASWANGSSTAGQYQYGSKVTICHHTHSKKNPEVTITVGKAAVKAHLKHGDTLGACASSKHHSSTTTTSSTSEHGKGKGSDHGNKGHGGDPGHGNSSDHGNGSDQGNGSDHGKGHH